MQTMNPLAHQWARADESGVATVSPNSLMIDHGLFQGDSSSDAYQLKSYFDHLPLTQSPTSSPNTSGFAEFDRLSRPLKSHATFPLVAPSPGMRNGVTRAPYQDFNRPSISANHSFPPQPRRLSQDRRLTCTDLGTCPKGLGIESCSPQACFAAHSSPDVDMLKPQPDSPGHASTASSSRSSIGSKLVVPKLERYDSGYPDSNAEASATRAAASKTSKDCKPTRGRRVPHHLVERRYRENLNLQIETLRLALPSLKDATVYGGDMEDPAVPARMPSKTSIIVAAIGHISELHGKEADWAIEVTNLKNQVAGLEQLVNCDNCSMLQYLESLQIDQVSGQPG